MNEKILKRSVGRPAKKPSELVHNTRKRDFVQVETNAGFDEQVTQARFLLAAHRSQQTGREVPVGKVSMSAAIRFAVLWFIQNFKVEADDTTG